MQIPDEKIRLAIKIPTQWIYQTHVKPLRPHHLTSLTENQPVQIPQHPSPQYSNIPLRTAGRKRSAGLSAGLSQSLSRCLSRRRCGAAFVGNPWPTHPGGGIPKVGAGVLESLHPKWRVVRVRVGGIVLLTQTTSNDGWFF